MYKKSIWHESCHIDFSNTLEELAVTMCFIQKKTIWQESCHIDSSRIFETEKKDLCRRLLQNKNQYGKIRGIRSSRSFAPLHTIKVHKNRIVFFSWLIVDDVMADDEDQVHSFVLPSFHSFRFCFRFHFFMT
jgi:hypothetical protein